MSTFLDEDETGAHQLRQWSPSRLSISQLSWGEMGREGWQLKLEVSGNAGLAREVKRVAKSHLCRGNGLRWDREEKRSAETGSRHSLMLVNRYLLCRHVEGGLLGVE